MRDLTGRWIQVRNRLAAVQNRDGTGGDVSAEIRRILEERAIALARPQAPQSASPSADILSFSVAGVSMALRSGFVREVLAAPALTRVWRAPRQLLGLCPVRGAVLPVFDLLAILGLGAVSSGGQLVLVVKAEDPFGLAIDEVQADHAFPLHALTASADQPFVEGIAACGTLLLDGAALCGRSDLFL